MGLLTMAQAHLHTQGHESQSPTPRNHPFRWYLGLERAGPEGCGAVRVGLLKKPQPLTRYFFTLTRQHKSYLQGEDRGLDPGLELEFVERTRAFACRRDQGL